MQSTLARVAQQVGPAISTPSRAANTTVKPHPSGFDRIESNEKGNRNFEGQTGIIVVVVVEKVTRPNFRISSYRFQFEPVEEEEEEGEEILRWQLEGYFV